MLIVVHSVVSHRQHSVLDNLSVLVVPVLPDLHLTSGSILDLKHMAFLTTALT